jgi:adenine-specific DNA-methyltransferase
MPTKRELKEKLIGLLEDLFQLNQPELDFGLYRIMHAKSAQVRAFLRGDLPGIIEQTFGVAHLHDAQTKLEAARRRVVEQLGQEALNPDGSMASIFAGTPVGKEYQEALTAARAESGTDTSEEAVYDHLYRFFSRYYDDGDFLSRRYYARETPDRQRPYAIPYSGEEVVAYWANADQYYVKTSEYFSNYTFNLRPDDPDNLMPIHLRIVDATEGEHNNVKETEKRYFIIHTPAVVWEDGIPVVQFEYRPDPAKTGQDVTWQQKRRDEAVVAILGALRDIHGGRPYYDALCKPVGKDDTRTVLAKQLFNYTKRNSSDFFIHKNLGAFLRRELDFYIKNEVLLLDDVMGLANDELARKLNLVRALREIAERIIVFLAQLEDFQKRLWLKKKFIVDAQYCITLDRIPEAFYPEIAQSEAQRQEWVSLFAIDEIAETEDTPGYSQPLTVDFLRSNAGLPVDTRFFGDDFKARLVDAIDDIDDRCDGILIHSDNFQALNLIQQRYREQAKCIYIDPPYNTNSSSIPYKNGYKHSSWGSMMHDRLALLRQLMTPDSAIFVSIDKTERTILEHAMDRVFGSDNGVEELIWSMNTNNSQAPNYSTNHEYVEVYAKDRHIAEQDKGMFREPKPGYEEVMALVARLNPTYPPVSTIETELRALYKQHRIEFREEIEAQGLEWEDEKSSDLWKGLYNYNKAEYRDENGCFVPESEAQQQNARIWVWREDNISMPATKQAASTRDPDHPNWRFYKPPHPVTGKPCPHPKSGWKFAYADDEDSPDRRSFMSLDRDHRIVWGVDETKMPQLKRILHEVEINVAKSVFQDYSDGEKQTSAMFGRSGVFLAPKHADFVSRFIIHAGKADGLIIDCFGGTGSTAHAVIQLNRDDRGSRKYLLVEMGAYFDTVLKPRVLKAAYSSDWRAGKPISRDSVSHCIRYLRLESYEDTLNNLALPTSQDDGQVTMESLIREAGSDAYEEYLLRYLLEVETRGSQSLLNIDGFAEPDKYLLRVKRPGSDAQVQLPVDLLETFNYLLGLRVLHIGAPERWTANFNRATDEDLSEGERTRLVIEGWRGPSAAERGTLHKAEDGRWWFRPVEGWLPLPDGGREKALIVWRNLTGDPEQDNAMLDAWFESNRISVRDFEYDVIYVNGDNNLPNLRKEGERWKVRLIEEEFHRLMWDMEGV